MNFFKYLLVIALTMTAVVGFSQKKKYSVKNKKAIRSFEIALGHYESKRDDLAVKELEKAIGFDADFVEAHMMLGNIYFEGRDYPKSIKHLTSAVEIDPKFYLKNYYSLGASELAYGAYADAKTHLEKYTKSGKVDRMLEKRCEIMLAIANFGANAVANPVPFDPKNLGKGINSSVNEYHPAISLDNQTLIYTRMNENPGSRDKYNEDFYHTQNGTNGWEIAKPFGPPMNSNLDEGAGSLSPDGQTFIFAACGRDDGYGRCDIYISNWLGDRWSKPKNIGPPVNSKAWDSQPILSSDGRTLYFVSTRGTGGMNERENSSIWRSVLNEDGTWGKPDKLPFCTTGNEKSPFIHPDGTTLYFASDGLLGMGNSDLYVTRMNSEGYFSTPENLGYPINTAADEHGLIVDPNGEIAYFASNRKDGEGGLDLYGFELYEKARPQKVNYSKGMVYDIETGEKLKAKIELIDIASEKVVVQSHSAPVSGEFLICLPPLKDYALNVSKEGYMFYSESFTLKEGSDKESFALKVPLQPLKEGGTVVLKNVFFATNKYDLKLESKAELDKLVAFLNHNPKVTIQLSGHTDDVGNKNDNQVLSENRAKAVVAYLVNVGIDAARLTSVGYGDTAPIAKNDTESNRQLNRRTEFKIVTVQ